MKNERPMNSSENSYRIGSGSGRHYSFLDKSHSVFLRTNYYNDMLSVHPWTRRPRSRHSGIPFPALYTTPCSPRMNDLARHKIKREPHIRQEFLDNYLNYAYTGVSRGALTAQCPESLAALARPRQTSTTSRNAPKRQQQAAGNDARAQPANPTNAPAKPRKK